jgi:type VI secretion system Hcp family effector
MFVYMQVDEIKGSATGSKQGWIWLEKCTLGFERPAETQEEGETGESAKRAQIQPVIIEKPSDVSTPKLAQWLCDGDPRTVKIQFCMKPNELIMEWSLTRAKMRSYFVSLDDAKGGVMEQLSLTYEAIEVHYKQTGANSQVGSREAFFELEAGA